MRRPTEPTPSLTTDLAPEEPANEQANPQIVHVPT